MVRWLVATIAGGLLSACAVGPDHVRPSVSVPEHFARALHESRESLPDATAKFWLRFGDDLLSQLIDEALMANADLRIGLARWDQALALQRQSRADRWPTITADSSASTSRASQDQRPGVIRADRDIDDFNVGMRAFWELDFFGRVRRQIEAQSALTAASEAELHALQVIVVSELATTYFNLRGSQARLAVARDNAENQRESLRLVQARLDAGQGTEFDTARARAQWSATQARIPALEAAIAVDMHRIAVLIGRTPDSLIATLRETRSLPDLPTSLDPGTPGDLLRRRPDIAAAEARLASATARIGVVTADLFPRITLGGLIGSQSADTGQLFERDSETRMLALGIDWSFLDIGRVRARIAASEADAAAHLASYQQTVLRAFEETENALAVHQQSRIALVHLQDAATASARATGLARLQFDGGLVEFLQVLDAERVQLDAQDQLAQRRAETAIALVGLYRALAGGWPERLPTMAAASHR